MWKECLLLKVYRHFNLLKASNRAKYVLRDNAMTNGFQKGCSRKKRSSNVLAEFEGIELDYLEAEMDLPKKATKVKENSAPT